MTISQNIHELHDPVTIPQVFNKAKHQPSNDRIQREPTFGRLNQQVNIVFCRMWGFLGLLGISPLPSRLDFQTGNFLA